MSKKDSATVGLISGLCVAGACVGVLLLLESEAPRGSSVRRSIVYAQGAVLGLGAAIGPTCGTLIYYLKRP